MSDEIHENRRYRRVVEVNAAISNQLTNKIVQIIDFQSRKHCLRNFQTDYLQMAYWVLFWPNARYEAPQGEILTCVWVSAHHMKAVLAVGGASGCVSYTVRLLAHN